jgi:leader peptidase (prepilin peptidase)/N-methyltransferase
MEVIGVAVFVLLGVAVGSFLNVCIDRLPGGESLVIPPSHCASCQHRLGARDLIPVFSYLWQRGRCRYCQAAIPRRLLWVEVGTAVLFGLLYWHYGLSIELAVAALYCCLFILLMVIDLEWGLILNKVVYPACGVALIIAIFLPQLEIVPEIKRALIGGGIGLGLFLLIVFVSRGGMGWGDVKMAALIGLVTGFPLILVALLLAVISGGLVSGVLLLLKAKQRRETVPFGPFLSLGAMATLFWGSSILDWYLQFL